jgi:hypothetical protein
MNGRQQILDEQSRKDEVDTLIYISLKCEKINLTYQNQAGHAFSHPYRLFSGRCKHAMQNKN